MNLPEETKKEMLSEFKKILKESSEEQLFHVLDRFMSAIVDNLMDESCPTINNWVMERT